MSKTETDTVKEPLQCRFCKETSDLGVWMHEADEPEKHFICHECWSIIASLVGQMLVPALREQLHYAEDYLKGLGTVVRGVRVGATKT